MNKKKAAVSAVLLMGAVLFGGWLFLVSRPEFALWQLQRAVSSHDVVAFENVVDLDSVLGRLVNDFVDSGIALDDGESGLGGLGTALLKGASALLKPTLVSEMKAMTIRFVETGRTGISQGDKLGAHSERAGAVKSIIDTVGSAPSDQVTLVRDGRLARLAIPLAANELEVEQLVFLMSRRGVQWRVRELENVDEIVGAIHRLQRRKLSEANANADREMIEKVKPMAVVTATFKDKEERRVGIAAVTLAAPDAKRRDGWSAWYGQIELPNNAGFLPIGGEINELEFNKDGNAVMLAAYDVDTNEILDPASVDRWVSEKGIKPSTKETYTADILHLMRVELKSGKTIGRFETFADMEAGSVISVNAIRNL